MRRSATAAAVLLLQLLLLPSAATAGWTASGTGTATVGADMLDNATGLTSTCVLGGIRLTWSVSTDPYVTAYRITRTVTPGGTTVVLPDQAAGTTSYNDIFVAAISSTYSYTISARVQNWTTTPLAAPTRTYNLLASCL